MVRYDNYERDEQPTERQLNPNFRMGAGPMERDLPENLYDSSMDNTNYEDANYNDALLGGYSYVQSGDELRRMLQAYGDKNVGLGGILRGHGNISGAAGARGAKAANAVKGMGKMTNMNRSFLLGGLISGVSDISKELSGAAFDPMAAVTGGILSAGDGADASLEAVENNFGRGRYDPESDTYANDQFKGRRANALASLRGDNKGPTTYDRTMGAAQAGLNSLSAGGSDVISGTIGNMFDKNYSKNAGMDMDPYGAGKLGYNSTAWILNNWDRLMNNNEGIKTKQLTQEEIDALEEQDRIEELQRLNQYTNR